MDRIILASASPRRKQLLEWAEIPFDVMPSDADELIPDGIAGFRNPGIPGKPESSPGAKKSCPGIKSFWQLIPLLYWISRCWVNRWTGQMPSVCFLFYPDGFIR